MILALSDAVATMWGAGIGAVLGAGIAGVTAWVVARQANEAALAALRTTIEGQADLAAQERDQRRLEDLYVDLLAAVRRVDWRVDYHSAGDLFPDTGDDEWAHLAARLGLVGSPAVQELYEMWRAALGLYIAARNTEADGPDGLITADDLHSRVGEARAGLRFVLLDLNKAAAAELTAAGREQLP